ncbi:MAG: hypothetical protein GY758_01390 [Fuerstiella sp.]|nr:hypothetical protein [Fuerstiella sp.]
MPADTHQLTAGDGYQCSNERRIHVGRGWSATVDRLVVVWPSGATHEFRDVPTDQSMTPGKGENSLETS